MITSLLFAVLTVRKFKSGTVRFSQAAVSGSAPCDLDNDRIMGGKRRLLLFQILRTVMGSELPGFGLPRGHCYDFKPLISSPKQAKGRQHLADIGLTGGYRVNWRI